MSRYQLTLAPLRVRVVTTRSCLQSWNYDNLTNGLVLSDINQLVVGDLTYVFISKYRFYLFCLTDVYSARIVGYCFHTRQRKTEAKAALDMWIKTRGANVLGDCIHHTDGGGQYFSKAYLTSLGSLGVCVSVARDCLQNGYAEQRNNLMKNHLIPTARFVDATQFRKEVGRMMYEYNYERKQEGLGWKSPVEFEKDLSTLHHRPVRKLHDWRL